MQARKTMKWQDIAFATIAALALAVLTLAAVAQPSEKTFDGRKFFEELASRGIDTKGVDGNKFFEEIAGNGARSRSPIDGARFFEELQRRGVAIKDIDGERLLGEMRQRGVMMPDMVLINRDVPTSPH